jgi:thiamine-monophosphate kinase
VDVVIDTDALPIDDVTRRIAAAFGRDPVELALTGGEDYELLFTCSPENVEALALELAPLPLQRVGDVASGTGTVSVRRNGRPLNVVSAGWRHF